MKKLLILVLIIFACILASFYPKNEKQILEMSTSGTYTIYLNNRLNQIDSSSIMKTNLGDGEILTCDIKNMEEVYDFLVGKKSECITVSYNEKFLSEILSGINIKKIENYENVKIYYGYKKGLPNKIKIDKYLVNIGVYVLDNCIKIASPIILTSF